MSKSYQLWSSPFIYLHEVIAPCTCIKSPITFCYQILLLLTLICFLNLILASGIPIKYSSVTTKFLSISYYQLLLSATISYFYLLITQYLLRLLLTGTPYQLLLPTPISYYYQLLVTGSLTTPYCISYSHQPVFSATIFRYC